MQTVHAITNLEMNLKKIISKSVSSVTAKSKVLEKPTRWKKRLSFEGQLEENNSETLLYILHKKTGIVKLGFKSKATILNFLFLMSLISVENIGVIAN